MMMMMMMMMMVHCHTDRRCNAGLAFLQDTEARKAQLYKWGHIAAQIEGVPQYFSYKLYGWAPPPKKNGLAGVRKSSEEF